MAHITFNYRHKLTLFKAISNIVGIKCPENIFNFKYARSLVIKNQAEKKWHNIEHRTETPKLKILPALVPPYVLKRKQGIVILISYYFYISVQDPL